VDHVAKTDPSLMLWCRRPLQPRVAHARVISSTTGVHTRPISRHVGTMKTLKEPSGSKAEEETGPWSSNALGSCRVRLRGHSSPKQKREVNNHCNVNGHCNVKINCARPLLSRRGPLRVTGWVRPVGSTSGPAPDPATGHTAASDNAQFYSRTISRRPACTRHVERSGRLLGQWFPLTLTVGEEVRHP
jgi:hypothetical protein